MQNKASISTALTVFTLLVFSQSPEKINLNHLLPEGYEINSISFSTDGSLGFFTASTEWENQIPYFISIDKDTLVHRIMELDTIYNGAISPSGKKIIYCVRGGEYTTIFLTRREKTTWNSPINLTKTSGITGGYFHWYSENDLYFYTPDINGDLVYAQLIDDQLILRKELESLNTSHTEFSPFVGPQKSYILFTRYQEGDETQQGIMISRNMGTEEQPQWGTPKRIQAIPYGWGAFILNQKLYFTDGIHIYSINFSI